MGPSGQFVMKNIANVNVKAKKNILYNPHFWIVTVITLIMIFVYSEWPWRTYKFTEGIWQWFPWLSSLYGLAIVEAKNHIIGIPFLIPILYSSVFFSWRGAMVISLLSLAGVLPILVGMWADYSTLLGNVALLLVPFFVVSIAAFEMEGRRKERKFFAEREEERKIYISKILEAQENERQRIAHDLHDDTIQTLLAVANSAETLVQSNYENADEVRQQAVWIRDMILDTTNDLRNTLFELRPSIIDNLGLVSALRWLTERMNSESNTQTVFTTNSTEQKLAPQIEVHMFRIAQEALNNIKRHSNATEAVIFLEFYDEYLKMTIQDNGKGFATPKKISSLAANDKLGLIGIHERSDFIGGKFRINSSPGKGTTLSVEVKYKL
jgi:two-component system sensor histidine kinase DegS